MSERKIQIRPEQAAYLLELDAAARSATKRFRAAFEAVLAGEYKDGETLSLESIEKDGTITMSQQDIVPAVASPEERSG